VQGTAISLAGRSVEGAVRTGRESEGQADDAALRGSMLEVVALLEHRGFNHGSTGNVSCRVDGGMLITPTGGNSANLTAERIVKLGGDGAVVGSGIPSSEWHMHAAILDAFPHVQAVVHTHADSCVALSCLGKPIPAFHYMIAGFGGNTIPCADYATFGTPALAQSAVRALEGHKACLLANHGMIAVGDSLKAALDITTKLETLARQYLLACSAGEPVIIPDEEMARVREQYKGYGRVRT
jgi:L-fuculose-phosphate aldolase